MGKGPWQSEQWKVVTEIQVNSSIILEDTPLPLKPSPTALISQFAQQVDRRHNYTVLKEKYCKICASDSIRY